MDEKYIVISVSKNLLEEYKSVCDLFDISVEDGLVRYINKVVKRKIRLIFIRIIFKYL